MLRIIAHIERLLLTQDCVIIPEVGGFVLQTVSATYQGKDHSFSPMRKRIVFNKILTHTDGLLPESYMQTYQVDYRKAQNMVEEDVADLKKALQQYGKVSLGNMGSLLQGDEGQIIYQAGKTDSFDVNYYGLTHFHFPVLAVKTEEEDVPRERKRKKDFLYIPVNMRFIRGAVASVAAIILFLLISTPVRDIEQSAYTASILPSQLILPKSEAVETPVETEKATEENTSSEISTPVVSTPKAEATAASPAIRKKMFHIVVGSFPSEEKANEFLGKLDHIAYPGAGVVIRDDRYRVYARKYDNREEAENYLSTIRETDKYKDAWLFIGR
ncbi:SPOR domain-containing protein [Parabacteroides sp. 52]|uniref:HU domain-containing protein n=1 Tax=unclassified Parabacteroides TaxID=2649774 RepID=UPI0013D60138|nr:MULTISPECIES: SPOR domain-containing protein [unclassified Parabacteroides]MDH6534274.1 hypothetical protein [Parabacteroides sp. PM5-20]NDV55342.1 SPOR domain-containing protein [Parabacteroides sp. 52]